MLREAIESGATVEEALQSACNALGIEPADAQFEILQMPTKKTFGLFGGSSAIVRVYIKETPVAIAERYLKQILQDMELADARLEIQESENLATINIMGDSASLIIGHHGETLDALQYLVGLAANRKGEGYCRISLNVGNYRENRTKTLQNMARKAAKQVLRTGRNYHFEPMNSYERRIIHTAIQEVQGVTSWSVGESLHRHVVVGTTSKPSKSSYSRKRNHKEKRRTKVENVERTNNIEKPIEEPQIEEPALKFDDSFDLFASLDRKTRILDAPVANTSSSSLLRTTDKLNSTPLYGRIDLDK